MEHDVRAVLTDLAHHFERRCEQATASTDFDAGYRTAMNEVRNELLHAAAQAQLRQPQPKELEV